MKYFVFNILIFLSLGLSAQFGARSVTGYYGLNASVDTGSAPPAEPRVLLNFTRFTVNGAPWVDLNADARVTGTKATNVNDEFGTPTTIDVIVDVAATESFYSSPGSTGSNSGPYPDNVQTRAWGSNNASWTVRIAGLEVSTSYSFTFFASQQNFHSNSQNIEFNGGATQTMTGLFDNKTTLFPYTVTSNGSGEVSIRCFPTGTSYAVLGALVIQKL